MKDSLFDLLLDLFEKTIAQLKEHCPEETPVSSSTLEDSTERLLSTHKMSVSEKRAVVQVAVVRAPSEKSFRVLTAQEQIRLTKVSYQFLYRLVAWGVISPDMMELILNRLMLSEAHLIPLEELKSVIRHMLAGTLESDQLAFLDLILYDQAYGYSLN